MPCTDFISDFLTVVRNASRAGKDKMTAAASNSTIRIAEILKEEGFIESAKLFTEGKKRFLRIHLKYLQGRKPAIQGIQRVSTPGLRVYVSSDRVPRIQGGLGVAIVSTSKGVMTDKKARQSHIGGELICKVW